MSEVKKENTSKKKEILKKLRGFLVIALVAAVSILGTLAYLSRKTDRVTNTFTATEDIKITVIEPSFTPPPGGYQPDVTYPKDPRLANVTGTENDDEWVIMRVDYRTFTDGEPEEKDGKKVKTRTYTQVNYADITHEQLSTQSALPTTAPKGLITINDDLANIAADKNWIKVKSEWLDDELQAKVFGGTYDGTTYTAQKCDYFIYKTTIKSNTNVNSEAAAKTNLGSSSVTAPLFDSVTIKSQEQLVHNGYTMDTLPGFTIDILGGAIKNSGDKTVEIASGNLDIANLATAGTNENPNVSRTIVNELVKLLLNEDPATSEEIAVD
ncbi:MAG: hypothetical protein K2N51_10820 [Lachnospiraceae bacterium]|nr:hypothetical protein [Lachnospiraceae bacterium]